MTGTRALEVAGRLGDLPLRILTTTFLEQVHYFRGEYERVVELATDNLAAVPADRLDEQFGPAAPASFYDRYWLVRGLFELGRFAEAAQHAAEALRLAEPTHRAYIVGRAQLNAGWLHLHRGDWAKARPMVEHATAAFRTGNIVLDLPNAVASSAWALAQARRGERGADPAPGRRAARRASPGEGIPRLRRVDLPSAGSGRSAARPARRGAEPRRPRSRILAAVSPGSQPMLCTCSATSRPIPTGSTPTLARPTTASRWPSPSRAACGPSSPTATSASANSSGARTIASRLMSTSPPRRRCTARWTCSSGLSRRRRK